MQGTHTLFKKIIWIGHMCLSGVWCKVGSKNGTQHDIYLDKNYVLKNNSKILYFRHYLGGGLGIQLKNQHTCILNNHN